MSRLRLFEPAFDEEHVPAVIPFTPRFREYRPVNSTAVVNRARLWSSNQMCPACRRVTVEPVELQDGLLNNRQEVIPGTATIVGFSCTSCQHEWPVIQNRAL